MGWRLMDLLFLQKSHTHTFLCRFFEILTTVTDDCLNPFHQIRRDVRGSYIYERSEGNRSPVSSWAFTFDWQAKWDCPYIGEHELSMNWAGFAILFFLFLFFLKHIVPRVMLCHFYFNSSLYLTCTILKHAPNFKKTQWLGEWERGGFHEII